MNLHMHTYIFNKHDHTFFKKPFDLAKHRIHFWHVYLLLHVCGFITPQEGPGPTWLGDIRQADRAQRDNLVQGEVYGMDWSKVAVTKGRMRTYTWAKGAHQIDIEKVEYKHVFIMWLTVLMFSVSHSLSPRKPRGETVGLMTPPWCCLSFNHPFPPSWTV